MPLAFPKPPISPVGKSWYPLAFPNAPRSHQVQSKHDIKNEKKSQCFGREAWVRVREKAGERFELQAASARARPVSCAAKYIYVFLLMQIISVNPAEGLKSVWGNLFLPILGHCRPLPNWTGSVGWTLLLETFVEHFSRKPLLDALAGNFGWSLELET